MVDTPNSQDSKKNTARLTARNHRKPKGKRQFEVRAGTKRTMTTESKKDPAHLPTSHLLRWPVLRRHEPLDAAAAALDA